jgi:hypothetical protein
MVLVQVSSAACEMLSALAVHANCLQAFLSVSNVVCYAQVDESRMRSAEIGMTLLLNNLVPFFYILVICVRVSSGICVETLIFEKMLASSVFVDCRIPNFKRSAVYRYFVGSFSFFVVHYFCLTSAAISISANPIAIEIQYATRLIGNNVLALIGGVYFIYNLFCEGPLIGRSSNFAMRERSPDTLKRIASMRVVAIPQLMLAAKAFVCASELLRRSARNNASSKLEAAARCRMHSIAHFYSLALSLSVADAEALESVAFGKNKWSIQALNAKLLALKSKMVPSTWLVKYKLCVLCLQCVSLISKQVPLTQSISIIFRAYCKTSCPRMDFLDLHHSIVSVGFLPLSVSTHEPEDRCRCMAVQAGSLSCVAQKCVRSRCASSDLLGLKCRCIFIWHFIPRESV